MTAALLIRPAAASDRPQLRQAVVALQDYEHARHATRLPGEQIADAYLDWMQRQAEADGVVLVAERDGHVLGFVAGWIEHSDNIGETADSNRFGYICDICVMPDFRGQRIAAQLLAAIEQHFRRAGIARLRICSLAVNTSAQASYQRSGFVPYEILFEKLIEPGEC
jgi:ribosomal protein S18 acetylase RimI-like enzyme